MRPPFPSVFDSSALAAFRSCPRKFELEFLEHWRPGTQSVHLHAGAAYADGLEGARRAFYSDATDSEAAQGIGLQQLMEAYGGFECPPDSPKSLERTAGALEFYFSKYSLEDDQAKPITLPSGRRGIEVSFAEPIDLEDEAMYHPNGDPLIYCGRADMIVEYQGMILGLDDKTTSQLGATWPRQWDLRSQFTGYSWGFRKMHIDIKGWLIRGLAILKTQYNTMEAITYRPEWEIARWHFQLKRDVKRIRALWEEGYFDYNLDHACTEYGGCVFRQACKMKDPQPLLEQQFERRRWDPIRRIEIPMAIIEDQLVEAA